MFGSMKGMGDVMKLVSQAGKIKENMQQAHERARERSAVGESGAGMVKVTANGIGEIIGVQLDPEALNEPESLGPLITAAVNVALQKGKEILLEETRTAMGGIDLPPGLM
jgi:DNA-binding YbaB/EbfC family protein